MVLWGAVSKTIFIHRVDHCSVRMILETVPAIQALIVEEKLLVAGEILRAASATEEPVPPGLAALLDERLQHTGNARRMS